MTLSNYQALAIALTPGAAEYLENRANTVGNFPMYGLANRAKNARNFLCMSLAMIAIATTVEVVFNKNTTTRYVSMAVAAVGGGLSVFFAKILYETISQIQGAMNHGDPLTGMV